MATEQNDGKNTNNNEDAGNNGGKKQQARNLYFLSGLTQAQIAELVGVAQKTISVWMNEGRWKYLKDAAEQTPAALIDHMSSELTELHANIAMREPGKRFATLQEAEIRRKTMATIHSLKNKQATAVHVEVMLNFMNYIKTHAVRPEDIQIALTLADSYLTGEMKLTGKPAFKPYTLPGQIHLPLPYGHPINPAICPKEEDSDTKDTSKAA